MNTTTERPNVHQLHPRRIKAERIARAMQFAHPGITATSLPCSEFFRDETTDVRVIIAAIATVLSGERVHQPSDETWNMAVDMCESSERASHLGGGRAGASGMSSPVVK